MKKTIRVFFTFLILLSLNSYAQCTFHIFGKITDLHTGQGIKNITIQLLSSKGNELTSITDSFGEYAISNLCQDKYLVKISHREYITKTLEIIIKSNLNQDFSLEHNEKELQQIITIGKSLEKTKTSIENKLSKNQINELSGTNLGIALSTIAGVSILRTGNNIAKPIIHGLHSSRVPIFNNAIRQEDQQWGVEHAPDIDLNLANSISIIKGAGALQYAGDATGGIVLVEPKKLYAKDTLTGSLLTSYVSNGKGENITAQLDKGWKKGWALRLQGTYKRSGDLMAPDYVMSNTGLKENDFSIQVGRNHSKYGVELFYSYFGSEIGILKAALIGNLENLLNAINNKQPLVIDDFTMKINSPKQKIQHNLFKFNTHYNFSLGKLSLVYGYQFNNRKEYDIRRSEFANKASLNLDLTTHTVNLDFESSNGTKLRTKLGSSYSYQENFPNAGTGVSPLIPFYEKNNYSFYWIEYFNINKELVIEGGIRFDHQKIDALKFYKKSRWASLGYDKKYSKKIIKDTGLNYLVNPVLTYEGFASTLGAKLKLGNSDNITFNYSLSSRAPNPSELFSDGLHHSAASIDLGDLELKNEKSSKIMTTYRGNWLNNKLNFELTVYYNYINDFINSIPIGAEYTIRGAFPVWQYQQTNAKIYGTDLMADYQLAAQFKFSTNFSYLRGKDIKNNSSLISMPPLQWVNSIEYRNSKWKNYFAKFTSTSVLKQAHYPNYNLEIDIVKNGVMTSETLDISSPPAAYQLFDFVTGFSLNISTINLMNISLGIRNIFNTTYRDYMNRLRYYTDETGRSFLLKIQYNF
ncbi:iron complex outermembrane recepter protein [Apibacter mensalis]|uniref:Iron complex outermembrane recepter protein n=1 Tax=Apibacter mensalis TaxID=1586267 RepID=A0A0X3AQK2_9FLAO|nr:TonB-dependent receptor [Apibacter mensalis]CVK16636.1 iron complex outermembrane recepter protein [Apibacter mensalis]